MNNLILNAEKRGEEIKAKTLLENGKIPAVIYGHGFKNQNVSVPYLNFQ